MNVNKNLLLRNLQYEIKRIGVDAEVLTPILDSRGEATGAEESIGVIKGIFHQTQVRQSKSVKDSVLYVSKPQPMFLCLKSEYEKFTFTVNDILTIGNKSYKIIGVNNIESMNVAYDFTLELVKDGSVEI